MLMGDYLTARIVCIRVHLLLLVFLHFLKMDIVYPGRPPTAFPITLLGPEQRIQ